MLFVVVPFRNRHCHWDEFYTSVVQPLLTMHCNVRVIKAEQSADGKRFNRGALANAGLLELLQRHAWTFDDMVLVHDVDLIPHEDMLRAYNDVSLGRIVHFGCNFERYQGDAYAGGVIRCTLGTWFAINGFPNSFWGWGGEDDVLYKRLSHYYIERPRFEPYMDLEAMSVREKLNQLRDDDAKCPNKHELMASCRPHNGLLATQYSVKDTIACDRDRPFLHHVVLELKVDARQHRISSVQRSVRNVGRKRHNRLI